MKRAVVSGVNGPVERHRRARRRTGGGGASGRGPRHQVPRRRCPFDGEQHDGARIAQRVDRRAERLQLVPYSEARNRRRESRRAPHGRRQHLRRRSDAPAAPPRSGRARRRRSRRDVPLEQIDSVGCSVNTTRAPRSAAIIPGTPMPQPSSITCLPRQQCGLRSSCCSQSWIAARQNTVPAHAAPEKMGSSSFSLILRSSRSLRSTASGTVTSSVCSHAAPESVSTPSLRRRIPSIGRCWCGAMGGDRQFHKQWISLRSGCWRRPHGVSLAVSAIRAPMQQRRSAVAHEHARARR